MFKHYLKIGFRNLIKYKLQSIISIAGLSVGFVCFCLSAFWIHHELTYDNFHKDAHLIYRVRVADTWKGVGLSSITPYPLAGYLKETFPEIKEACSISGWESSVTVDNKEHQISYLMVDSAFMNMFSVSLLSGNNTFMQPETNKAAITPEAAVRFFGNDNPLGKKINSLREEQTVEAIVPAWAKQTNIPFDIIKGIEPYNKFNASTCETYIRLNSGTDIRQFAAKLHEHKIEKDGITLPPITITPITALHYTQPRNESIVQINHVMLFALSGALVIFCALFNYLTLLVSRIRMRSKELALYRVNGASGKSLLVLLSTELLLNLCCALILGVLLTEWLLPEFKELAGIHTENPVIYLEMSGYAIVIITCTILISLVPIYYFQNKTLQVSIKGEDSGRSRNLFRRGSVLAQLIISIGFIFCSSVLFKQIHFLNQVDMGLERKNIATLNVYAKDKDLAAIEQEIKKIPGITQVLCVERALLPQGFGMMAKVKRWEEKASDAPDINLQIVNGSEAYIQFYNFALLKGKIFGKEDTETSDIIINEAAWKAFGWKEPIGKKISFGLEQSQEHTIIGVIKDFYIDSPTLPVQPVAIENKTWQRQYGDILYKYKDENKKQCEEQILKIMKDKFPLYRTQITNMEDTYTGYLQSEQALLLLLGFVSVVCILVSLFGIYSQVSLACEEKRKEIAIRKVNGATVNSILQLFFNEYLLLLGIASFIAFPVGYVIMKPWTENYIRQTEINSWLYLVIFVLAGVVITGSILARVWKAANTNPAIVVKSE